MQTETEVLQNNFLLFGYFYYFLFILFYSISSQSILVHSCLIYPPLKKMWVVIHQIDFPLNQSHSLNHTTLGFTLEDGIPES